MDNLQESIENSEPEAIDPITTEPISGPGNFWREVWRDKKLVYSTVGVFVFVMVAGAGAYFLIFGKRTPPPPPPDVVLTLAPPSRVIAGQPMDLKVDYSNRSSENLRDLQMSIIYPTEFTFEESTPAPSSSNGTTFQLADIGPSGTGSVQVKGVVNGQIGDKKQFKVVLRYKISGFNTTYSSEQVLDATLSAPDLSLTLVGPTEITAGQEAIYNLAYRNISDKALRN